MLTPMLVDLSVFRGVQTGGRIVIDVAGNQDIALPSEAVQAGIITYTGQLTGNITARLPLLAENAGKQWLLDNQSSGLGFTITTAGLAGAGVSVPQGRKQYLGWNGVTIFTENDGSVQHETVIIPKVGAGNLLLVNTQYKCGHIEITGTGGGGPTAPFNVVVPLSGGLYVFDNRTDQVMTVRGGSVLGTSGLGVQIAAGRVAQVRCNGVDIRRITADTDPTLGQVA